MPQKYYAVKAGRKIGIFTQPWSVVQTYVSGYPGAIYKGFTTKTAAAAFMGTGATTTSPATGTMPPTNDAAAVQTEATIYVDGSFDLRTKRVSYAFIVAGTGEHQNGIVDNNQDMRNVSGEVTAAEYAIQWAIDAGLTSVTIAYDYMGIQMWADGKWKANKPRTQAYQRNVAALREQITVVFTKVKAHTGVNYNEQVDGLAKAALGIKK